jgi:hypothetical protein
MDIQAKYDLMQKVSRELEDLKNSQTAVIKKIGQIEAHNINLSDAALEKELADVYESVAQNLEKVESVDTSFRQKVEKFAIDNKLQVAEAELV